MIPTENNEINNINSNPKKDLKLLLQQMSIDYGVEKQNLTEIINNESIQNISDFKKELEKLEHKSYNSENIDNLYDIVTRLKTEILDNSQNHLNSLKQNYESANTFDKPHKIISDFLNNTTISKAMNPKTLHENILALSLGSINSIVAVIDMGYNLGKDIILTPYHIFLLVSGKAKTNDFKNI